MQGARASPKWAKVVGLHVSSNGERLHWRRGSDALEVLLVITRQSNFPVCGNLVGHFPVCSWLRVVVAAIKQCATSVSSGWDDEVWDATLRSMWLKPWLEWLGMIQCEEIGVSTGMNSSFRWMPAHLPWELPLKLTAPLWKMLALAGKWCKTYKPSWTWCHFKGS